MSYLQLKPLLKLQNLLFHHFQPIGPLLSLCLLNLIKVRLMLSLHLLLLHGCYLPEFFFFFNSHLFWMLGWVLIFCLNHFSRTLITRFTIALESFLSTLFITFGVCCTVRCLIMKCKHLILIWVDTVRWSYILRLWQRWISIDIINWVLINDLYIRVFLLILVKQHCIKL